MASVWLAVTSAPGVTRARPMRPPIGASTVAKRSCVRAVSSAARCASRLASACL
ncbi:hypothetical protein NB717_003219 [Xanthomonas sacchari]|nr:hypothetical protein [Xanthomonas sacchari]